MFEIYSTCKGGGYRYCRTNPPHPRRNSKGLYPLHIVRMENKLGRLLGKGEVVHHKDEDKTNDDPDNLEVMSNPRHSSLHRDKAEIVELTCPCGNKFLMKDYLAAKAIRWSKSKVLHCSKSCGGRTARKLQMLS